MKKTVSLLIIALLLSIIQPCFAKLDNFTAINISNGYIALDALSNDKFVSKQWYIESTNISYAWDKGYNGDGVRIAVIDSGIDAQHEDLAGAKIDTGKNFIDGSHDVTDQLWHGTFVSGILAAVRDNGLGVAGFCTGATIVPLKCFSDSLQTKERYVISAIYAAVDDYGCDVINLSVGTDTDLKELEDVVEYAAGKGVIVVSSVGNDGTDEKDYPAAYKCVIGVGAVDSAGTVSSFSQRNDSVYVVAPGVNIPGLGNSSSSAYISASGTSFSAPFVTAAAAILKQYAPNATFFDFATLIRESAVDKGEKGYDTSYGYGCLDYKRFIEAMEAYDFKDVGAAYPDTEGHWAKESIRYCVNRSLFNGVTATSFEPETDMSRAMFVKVLARLSGDDLSNYTNDFKDVSQDAWYSDACSWASAKGIVTGIGDGTFNPDGKITREQIAVMLYRYAKLYGVSDGSFDDTDSGFADSGSISVWAMDAMLWASQNELITGRGDNTVCPLDSAKRCELAAIMSRFINNLRN